MPSLPPPAVPLVQDSLASGPNLWGGKGISWLCNRKENKRLRLTAVIKETPKGEVCWASLWTGFANCKKRPKAYDKNVQLAHHAMTAQKAVTLSDDHHHHHHHRRRRRRRHHHYRHHHYYHIYYLCDYAVCMQQAHCGIGPTHVNNIHMTVCKIMSLLS